MDKSKNILVTGGAGYIGSHMVCTLLNEEYTPIVFDNLSTGYRESIPEEVTFIKGDLRKESDIRQVFDRYPIDTVMHFAASIVVPESVSNPIEYYENNVLASINLLKVLLQHKVKRLIFSSSAAVYGEPKIIPIVEESPTLPTNPYGNSKLIVEGILKDIAKAYDFSYVSLRYFNAAGLHPSAGIAKRHNNETTHLIPNVVKVASGRKKELTIFGDDYPTPDGTCIRDYIYIQDLCEAHLLSLKALKEGMKSNVFNLGNGKGYSVKEVVQAAERVTGKKIRVKIGPRRKGDPARLVASSEKAKKILGWTAKAGLDEIIKSVWDSEQ